MLLTTCSTYANIYKQQKKWFLSQVGKATDCNSVIIGSSPVGTSILDAQVAKLVDAQDLKSCGLQTPCRFDSGPGHHSCASSSTG